MSALKRWQFWLGLVISLVFLYLALRGLGLKDLGSALKGANYLWLLPGILVYFVAVWVRAWRWHYLVRPVKAVPTRKMFPIVAIGYMGNNIYPARAGEVLRALVLKRRQDVPVSASLARRVAGSGRSGRSSGCGFSGRVRPRCAGVVMSASTIWPDVSTRAAPAPATKRAPTKAV